MDLGEGQHERHHPWSTKNRSRKIIRNSIVVIAVIAAYCTVAAQEPVKDLQNRHPNGTPVSKGIVPKLGNESIDSRSLSSGWLLFDKCLVFAVESVELPSQESGAIASLDVRENDAVSANQVIAKLEGRIAELEKSAAGLQAQAMQHTSTSEMLMYFKELLNLPIATILISFIIYFIGGYFLYSSFYASIGAAVDNETDSQQFLLPIIMPLILGVYIGFFTVMNDPNGTIATVFSMIPLTSPIVMMMRIPFGVPMWQIIVSMVILFGTFFGVVWFAAKIYRVGILMYGKKPTWRELIKWLKY